MFDLDGIRCGFWIGWEQYLFPPNPIPSTNPLQIYRPYQIGSGVGFRKNTENNTESEKDEHPSRSFSLSIFTLISASSFGSIHFNSTWIKAKLRKVKLRKKPENPCKIRKIWKGKRKSGWVWVRFSPVCWRAKKREKRREDKAENEGWRNQEKGWENETWNGFELSKFRTRFLFSDVGFGWDKMWILDWVGT